MKLIYFIYFIILLLSGSWFLCSCKFPKEEVLIYFQNNNFDDGPFDWPEFNMYEDLPDEAIRNLDDIFLDTQDFNCLENKLLNITEKPIVSKVENSINGYDENIYIIINQKDSIYFNKYNNFFSKNDLFICKNEKIAKYIRTIIRYESYFSEEKKVSSIYSKVTIKSKSLF
ncbi:hypothetical protein [Sphingobacterium daejeonense]|uniref:hypothetical protein n=1 Tax=Sphingobacterium daejeonense TaxID=371142 RepID=UPI003D31AF5A